MEIDEKRLVKTLQDLVRIRSFESSDEMSNFVRKELEEIGLQVEVFGDKSLIAKIGKGKGFVLNSHMDTVGNLEGWKTEPFGGEVKGDKLYGRGATDCKAGVAAMLELARILSKEKLDKQVIFVFGAYEEGKRPNSMNSLVSKIKAECGLVLEPNTREDKGIEISTGCRGRYQFLIEVLGKSAHSGYPELGDNAIYKAAKFMKEFQRLKPLKISTKFGEITTSISITEISAKEGANIVPGKCVLTVDYRALPDQENKEACNHIKQICEKAFGKSYKLVNQGGVKGYLCDNENFLNLCKQSIEKNGFKVGSMDIKGGWFDGATFYRNGTGAYSLGPGTLGTLHEKDEYCHIPGFINCTKIVLDIIKEWNKK